MASFESSFNANSYEEDERFISSSKLNEDEVKDSLLIVCDTPNIPRIDGIDEPKKFKYVQSGYKFLYLY